LEEKTLAAQRTALQRFSRSVAGNGGETGGGCLVANPSGMVRRIGVRSTQFSGIATEDKSVYAAAVSGDETQLVVDVPPMGYVWLPAAGETRQKPARRRAETVAIDTRDKDGVIALRNEFFEVLVNPRTGSLQSIHDYASRGNQFSQQLAYKLPGQRRPAGAAWMDPVESAVYSSMIADEVRVTAASEVFGEITARGSLVAPDGRRLAGFSQWYRLWRGGRVVELEIELDPEEEPRADPWGSYYCARFAWPDEGADLYRTINDVRHKSEAVRFEAPQLIEVENGERRVAILTAGLPYHRRHGLRMLDSLLITRGETARRFRLGIGVDLPHAIHAATTFQLPDMVASTGTPPAASAAAAWLFQLDNRNVLPTSWSPWIEEGQIVGFRVRLLETAGRPARVQVKGFRDLAMARQVDFCNQEIGDCRLENGAMCVQLSGHEWAELEARWDTARPAADVNPAS
jgi:alpha-mannosidase